MKEEEKKIYEALNPTVESLGYELSEVRLSGGKNKTLSVVVDRVAPISLEDIVAVSEEINKVLDELDPIEDAYTLDISSLGAEKPLAVDKLPLYVGQYVSLHLSHPYKGENILEGTLMEVTDDTVTLKVKEKAKRALIHFPYADVDKARLAIDM
ncbi:MAG: ribosome maturation factor RimP [Bacilli bacterium]|nr:ribosome maturation factor RimP [Bacilli bacterium]